MDAGAGDNVNCLWKSPRDKWTLGGPVLAVSNGNVSSCFPWPETSWVGCGMDINDSENEGRISR